MFKTKLLAILGKGDFAHQKITTATALLTDVPGIQRPWWLGAALGGDVGIERNAGWLGDATLRPINFKDDDYRADLDAANIVFLMRREGVFYDIAYRQYYSALREDENIRATMFLTHTPIERVKLLIYPTLESHFGWITNHGEGMLKVWTNNGDDRFLEEIRYTFPDVYNFLRSLEEKSGRMLDYSELDP